MPISAWSRARGRSARASCPSHSATASRSRVYDSSGIHPDVRELRGRGLERAGERREEVLVAVQPHDLVDAVAAAQLVDARARVVAARPSQRRSYEASQSVTAMYANTYAA